MRWWFVACGVATGAACQQDLIANQFTPDEWADQMAQFQIDAGLVASHQCVSPSPPLDLSTDPDKCDGYARLGQEIFFDPALSGAVVADDHGPLATPGPIGTLSCASCHDPKQYYIDTRSLPADVSLGTGFTDPVTNTVPGNSSRTKHNALTLVNFALKAAYSADSNSGAVTWTGAGNYLRDVFEKLALPKAMDGCTANHTTQKFECASNVAAFVVAHHRDRYREVVGVDPEASDDASILANVENALDLYVRRLEQGGPSPFDSYIAGDNTALPTDAFHGLELFMTSAACVECHNGPALTDFQFHSNGVEQGPNDQPQAKELGNGQGLFLTPSLRNVSETGPYMHGGQKASLEEVLDFYRKGGGSIDTKDPRILPLDDLDDLDIEDLRKFLLALKAPAPDMKYGFVDSTTGLVTW